MKAFSLTLGIAFAGLVAGPSQASITIDVSKSAARGCYESAEARERSRAAVAQCTAALAEERIGSDARVATLVNRGIILMLSDRSSEALRDFDEALAIDAAQPEAYLNKGVTLFRIGNSRDAIPLANRALELRTQKPALAYFIRGLSQEEGGNLKAAYSDLRTAQSLDPRWQEPSAQLARYKVSR